MEFLCEDNTAKATNHVSRQRLTAPQTAQQLFAPFRGDYAIVEAFDSILQKSLPQHRILLLLDLALP